MAKKVPLEDKILQVAEELFMANGYDATSTTDIAKKAGCNQALIHYYFRTKENLFQQIFASVRERSHIGKSATKAKRSRYRSIGRWPIF